MHARKRKRIEGLRRAVATMPIRPAIVDRAFGVFCEEGVLPQEQRIADAVCRRALQASGPQNNVDIMMAALHPERVDLHVVQPGHKPGEASVRECVFHEAVFGTAMVRAGARTVLRWEIGNGADPCAPGFLADRTLPDFDAVGLHLLGLPQRLAKPPYEDQAHRLFARQDEVRRRSPDGDANALWLDELLDAAVAFSIDGTLPDDELLVEAVLADAEFAALVRHNQGHDVAEVMAALDRLALADDDDHTEALDAVVALYRAGVPR